MLRNGVEGEAELWLVEPIKLDMPGGKLLAGFEEEIASDGCTLTLVVACIGGVVSELVNDALVGFPAEVVS